MSGCSREAADVQEISFTPSLETVEPQDIALTVPAYGIVVGGGAYAELEVNIEAKDSPKILAGQKALAAVGTLKTAVECRVTRVLRNVNAVTGQSIAWLKPIAALPLPSGEFVSADITIGVRHRALAVPRQAVLIRDGATFVIQKQTDQHGTPVFVPVEVKAGLDFDEEIEILSGLKAGDLIVAKGGIAYLYPDFKESGD